MNCKSMRNALLVFVLASAALAVGCGGGAEGKYRDPSGTINAEFKDGKAYVALGAYAVDGTYKIDGNKIVARGDFGPMLPSPLIFTVNKRSSTTARIFFFPWLCINKLNFVPAPECKTLRRQLCGRSDLF